jgi:hypothetical protein
MCIKLQMLFIYCTDVASPDRVTSAVAPWDDAIGVVHLPLEPGPNWITVPGVP